MTEQKQRPSWRLPILLLLLLALVAGIIFWLFSSYRPKQKPFEITSTGMGTYVQQTIYGKNAQAAATAAMKAVNELEELISWRIEDSDIAKLNQEAGNDWIAIDKRTMDLLEQCLDVAQQSAGAFDPTILPLSALWDIGGENQQLPPSEKIQKFIPYVDYKNLRLDKAEGTASLKNSLDALDLGAAGKGAACDQAVKAYESSKAECGIVSVGGSVGLYGAKADGSDWLVAIRDPQKQLTGEGSAAMGTLSLEDGFLSTSGSYEKYFEQDGVLYHHILDPRTGYPAESGLLSVTVYAENGALSDLLSTACFLLGLEKGKALLDYYGAQGVFIDEGKGVYVTDGLQDALTITNEAYQLREWP